MKPRLLLVLACISLIAPIWSVALGQTLGSQYEIYLDAKCNAMHFQRDENFDLLPGQAGPNLYQYCTGPYSLASGGPSFSDISLGATGSELNSSSNDEGVLRRRRDRARNAATPQPGVDFNLIEANGNSLFLSFDYLRQKQEKTDYQSARDGHNNIVSLGIDHRFTTKGLIGAMARYAMESGDIDSSGHFESHGSGAVIYGSWFPVDHLFIDMNAGFDVRHLKTQHVVSRQETSVTYGMPYYMIDLETGQITVVTPPPIIRVYYAIPPQLATGRTDGSESTANLLLGYDVPLGRFSVGPRTGLRFRKTTTDAFVESGDTPMTLAFDKQATTSIMRTLGLQGSVTASVASWAVVMQTNVDWMHEYHGKQQTLTARFAEDFRPNPSKLYFLSQAPDRDTFATRLSIVAVLPHGISLFISAMSTFGNDLMSQRGITLGGRLEL